MIAKFLLKVFCVSLLFASGSQILAQTITVKGIVISEVDQLPMIGVNILIQDALDGTVTGFDGDAYQKPSELKRR